MVKIRILRNTICNKQPVSVNEVVDVSEAEAMLLVSLKKAAYEDRVIEQPETAVLPRGQKRSKKVTESPNAEGTGSASG